MKADWSKYPDNIGHLDSPGCFRCHDGKHVAAGDSRRVLATDCNSCHTILAQGAGAELAKLAPAGVAFKHPGADLPDGAPVHGLPQRQEPGELKARPGAARSAQPSATGAQRGLGSLRYWRRIPPP